MTNLQLTDTVVMVRPTYFGFNPETNSDNFFQKRTDLTGSILRKRVMAEFEGMVAVLIREGIRVIVLDSPLGKKGEITADAVYPNNWFSTHGERMVIYPLKALSQRNERQVEILITELAKFGISFKEKIDLTKDEKQGFSLEGTGSLVLDRLNKVAYGLSSQRTIEAEFKKWCKLMDYEPVLFEARDQKGQPIYHTNILMSIGEKFAVICDGLIDDLMIKERMLRKIKNTGHEIVSISYSQMNNYCANILALRNSKQVKLIIMSERAKNGFTVDQLEKLEKHGKIVTVKIDEIEKVGGGSASCMMAEIFYN